MSRLRWSAPHALPAIAVAAVLAALPLALPDSSHATTHAWDCVRSSGNDCSDYVATPYHPWIEISSFTHNGYVMYHVCANSVTAAGNQRSTTDGRTCNVNSFLRVSCLISTSPDSWGKVHWTDGSVGQGFQIYGRAYSPVDSAC